MEPITTSLAVLALIGDAFLAATAEHATGSFLQRLQRDPVKIAVRQAVAAALRRYAVDKRTALIKPLLGKDTLLALPKVAAEMAQLVRFERAPDVKMVGGLWRNSFESPDAVGSWIDFTAETQILFNYIEDELRSNPIFASVFEQKRIDVIADKVTDAIEAAAQSNQQQLLELCTRLDTLYQFLSDEIVELLTSIARAPEMVGSVVRDFSLYLAEKTGGFIGRQFLFDEIDDFMAHHDQGYYLLTGEPGIGKSAILAQLVKVWGCPHYFNVRAEGINQTSDFLRSTCAQLIARYKLSYRALPEQASQDSQFLSTLLHQISAQLAPGERCILVVDALDEAGEAKPAVGTNTLLLPRQLPPGIFIVASMRRLNDVSLIIQMPERVLRELRQDEADNTADIRAYIQSQMGDADIRQFMLREDIDDDTFLEELSRKSQGNFLYLRMVLPEIAAGTYTDLALDKVPVGLLGYYEDHWQRIREGGISDWFDYKLPVILALTVVKEPVSFELLHDFSGVQERRRVREVLQNFDQFLYKVDVAVDDPNQGIDHGHHQGPGHSLQQRRYRWYHASFFDFIAGKEEIAAERIDFKVAHGRIADVLWREVYGEDNELPSSA